MPMFNSFIIGVLGRVVIVVDLESLAPHRCRFESLDSFMWGSYAASLQSVDGSTQVPAHACNNA